MVSFLRTSSTLSIATTAWLLLSSSSVVTSSTAAESATNRHLRHSNHRGGGGRGLSDNDNEEEPTIQVCESYGTSENPYSDILKDPCLPEMKMEAPTKFTITFETNMYGKFIATCMRARAPVWVDRVYNLARYGYYNDNYFLRVIPNFVVQFGTAGDPTISNVYNYTSDKLGECAIIEPQPPYMSYCSKENCTTTTTSDEEDIIGLSNTYGTLSMSTSYNEDLSAYPKGVTWNATAELFINIGNNARLDKNLFIPICTIDHEDMENSVSQFPSFGELSDFGGTSTGPSLGKLYGQGNSYIESNSNWANTMAKTTKVDVCTIEA